MAERTPIAAFAARELDAIQQAFLDVAPRATEGELRDRPSRLLSRLRGIQREEEAQRGAGLAQRIADGLCAVLGDTCLTHNQKADLGHQLAIDPTTSTD